MDVAQIAGTQATSAKTLTKMNPTEHSSETKEDFDVTLRGEMDTSENNAAEPVLASDGAAVVGLPPEAAGFIPKPGAKVSRVQQGEAAVELKAKAPANSTRTEAVTVAQARAERTPPAMRDQRETVSKAKSESREGKSSGSISTEKDTKLQAETTSTASPVSEGGALGSATASAPDCVGVPVASLTVKQQGATVDGEVAKSARASGGSAARREGKVATPATVHEGTEAGKANVAATPEPVASASRASSGSLPPPSTVLPVSSVAAASAALQSLTPNHPGRAIAAGETRANSTISVGDSVGAHPQVIASGLSSLDVGVFDDIHGWLRIRAELDPGGSVNASLTVANSPAHEFLRAAVPEMANYLASEEVSVNRIAVHRLADNPSEMAGVRAESQMGGDAAGNRQGDTEARHGGAAASSSSLPTSRELIGLAVPTTSEGRDGLSTSGTTGLRGWMGTLSNGVPGLRFGFGFLGDNSGGWVNVSA